MPTQKQFFNDSTYTTMIELRTGSTPQIDFKNPFLKNKFKGMNIYVQERLFNAGEFTIQGDIKFKNGNTEGRQQFESSSIDGLLFEMKAFIDNLKEQP
jgi:hypothetical protein